ncbi:MAG: GGDEF domain-containing protein [Rhodocyclales bacterium]|nr:GGDEF domain-containing protein [Rhodocyclales bacterium]
MGKQETSALIQWIRDVATAESDSLAPYRDRVMHSMGGVTVLLLTPFTINNFLQQRYLVALILLFIQALTFANVYAVRCGRPVPVPFALLLVPFLAGITAAVMIQGVPGVLWSYPVIVYSYFVLSRRVAIACSLAMLCYLSWLTVHYIDSALALRVFGTLLLTIIMINIVLNVISDLHQTLAKQALTDPLTGCFNRRFMEQNLEVLVARAERHPIMATVLMIDVDLFKPINDAYGHDRGDLVLQGIVQAVGERLRRGERLFRWGGEEFLLLLEHTDADGAVVVAEDIRRAVEAAEILPGRSVTISIGVGQYQAGQSVEAWTKTADAALYRAKAAGRNCVVRADVVDVASATA